MSWDGNFVITPLFAGLDVVDDRKLVLSVDGTASVLYWKLQVCCRGFMNHFFSFYLPVYHDQSTHTYTYTHARVRAKLESFPLHLAHGAARMVQ